MQLRGLIMSKIKRSLSQDALDARELVEDGFLTWEEWERRYAPQYVDPVEKIGDMVEHDCHSELGEDGCAHPSHGEAE
jgi:hypothetical protein